MGEHMRAHWDQSIEGQLAIGELTFDDGRCCMVKAGLRLCENGCGRWLLHLELPRHRGEACPLQWLACPIPGCGKEFLRKDQDQHDAAYVNTHLRAERIALRVGEHACFSGCGAFVRECDVLEHAGACPRENLSCKAKDCIVVLPRAKMPYHVSVMHSRARGGDAVGGAGIEEEGEGAWVTGGS